MTSTPVKKSSAKKSLHLFTNILNVKKITAIHFIVPVKSKHKAMKAGNSLCTDKTKRKGHSKINDKIKRNLYAWITHHSQVV